MTAVPDVNPLTVPDASAELSEKAGNVAMSVRMATSMMSGVASALTATSKDLQTYETDIGRLQTVSENLQHQMNSLLSMSAKVADMLAVIEKVALQTRLLAFNATLEAARAGEQGRGFAVVATSVKDLAQQTRGATVEIRDALERIGDAARHTGLRGHELDEVVARIRTSTHAFAGTLTEQSEVSATACKYVDEAATSVDEIAASLTPKAD